VKRLIRGEMVTYQFESLAMEGLVHAVFTRRGGVSQGPFASLNVGKSVGDDPAAVAENLRRIYAHLELGAGQVVTARQVHGNRVAPVSGHDAGQVLPNTDGLVSATPGLALLLRFADCQPILLYDPEHHALSLIHAGWRGVAQGIARRAVEAMKDAFGSRPRALIAGLGPAIGPCCYAVGDEVAATMGYTLPDWSQVMHNDGENRWRFDLPAANAQLLAAAGVRQIEQASLCTACHQDEFFSHRADNGQTGRFAVVAFLQPRAAGPETQAAAPHPEEAMDRGTWPAIDSLSPPGFPGFDEFPGGEG
jgi:YfiH family protein